MSKISYLTLFLVISLLFQNISLTQQCLTKVKINSAGFDVGNNLKMKINEELITDLDYTRGLTLAVIDHNTGEYLFGETFDTWGQCASVSLMIQFINRIKKDDYVLVGVKDEASNCLDDLAYESLAQIGWDPKFKLGFRNSFTMIGQKGVRQPVPYQSSSTSHILMEKCLINSCNEQQIGNLCKPLEWVQKCGEEIDELVTNVTVEKDWKITIGNGGQVQHHFQFQYSDNFNFDSECFQQKITIGGSEIQKQSYEYDESTKTIKFQKPHKQVFQKCEYNDYEDKFEWKCNINISISMAGIEQHTFKFEMIKALYKSLEHNDIQDDHNQEIDTKIQFCQDKLCTKLKNHKDIMEFVRNEDIYFQVIILNEEYQDLFMKPLGVKIGNINNEILAQDSSQPGKTLFNIQTNIAQEKTTITVTQEIFDKYKNHQQQINTQKITTSHQISIIHSELDDNNN